ncbi:MAG: hypothetical protein IJN16_04235 [Lachnospiraceae bacterium]|nr:hypothetical protein [Lachnospiraceae bacterium]
MAGKQDPNQTMIITEKKKIQDEKRQFQKEQKQQRKEAKKRAREIAKRENELGENESGGFAAFMATLMIVIVWLAVIAVIIKLDIGGFGSNVLAPVLKDVPVINKILPGTHLTETTNPEAYGGYSNLQDAVDQIRLLEAELERANSTNMTQSQEIVDLKAEVARLSAFEEKQTDFQRIKTEFYEEVVYSENSPGAEEYKKFYEAMDPTTAEYIYRQVIIQLEEDQKVKDYAAAYSEMKPKQAAAIFEAMTDNLDLAARILGTMSAEDRGEILGVMDAGIAAKLTKIMDPET